MYGKILEMILIQVARHTGRTKRPGLKCRRIVIITEQEVGYGITGAAVPSWVGATATVREDRIVIKGELTEEVVGKVSLLYPAAIVEAHRKGVPAMSHRK